LRIAEKRHQPVAEALEDMAAEPGYGLRRLVEVSVDQVAPIFGVKLRGETGRPDEIAKHHGDRATLGVLAERSRGRRTDDGLRRRALGLLGRCVTQLRDRLDEAFAVPERNAELLEIGFDQLRQDFRVDLVLAEDRFVLAEADPL
jgi:hypothetical protein